MIEGSWKINSAGKRVPWASVSHCWGKKQEIAVRRDCAFWRIDGQTSGWGMPPVSPDTHPNPGVACAGGCVLHNLPHACAYTIGAVYQTAKESGPTHSTATTTGNRADASIGTYWGQCNSRRSDLLWGVCGTIIRGCRCGVCQVATPSLVSSSSEMLGNRRRGDGCRARQGRACCSSSGPCHWGNSPRGDGVLVGAGGWRAGRSADISFAVPGSCLRTTARAIGKCNLLGSKSSW